MHSRVDRVRELVPPMAEDAAPRAERFLVGAARTSAPCFKCVDRARSFLVATGCYFSHTVFAPALDARNERGCADGLARSHTYPRVGRFSSAGSVRNCSCSRIMLSSSPPAAAPVRFSRSPSCYSAPFAVQQVETSLRREPSLQTRMPFRSK